MHPASFIKRVSNSSANIVLLLLCLLTRSGSATAQLPEHLEVGKFSSLKVVETLPAGWQPLFFDRIKRYTDYSLVEDGGTVVVKAVSNGSASGLARVISIDPVEYPVIEWRWKVNNLLQKGDVSRKDGDDYPARVYITFAFDPDRASFLEHLQQKAARLIHGRDAPYRAMSYIWASNSTAGLMLPNSYTDRAIMFVVQGGDENMQQWVTETRNVYEDYKIAFGQEPTMITAVAIMTDTDNTGEFATAWYGDIVFRKKP